MTTAPACEHARAWLSATRDGEPDDDPGSALHLDRCRDCQAWADTFDRLTRVSRLRAPAPTPQLRAAVADLGLEARSDPRLRLARVLLAVAAAASALTIALAMAGVAGHFHLGSPEGRDAEALMLSLTGGFALTAWRPARLAAGLLPVAVLAAVVTGATSFGAATNGDTALLDELSHVPIFLGAIGTALAHRYTLPVAAVRPSQHAPSSSPLPA